MPFTPNTNLNPQNNENQPIPEPEEQELGLSSEEVAPETEIAPEAEVEASDVTPTPGAAPVAETGESKLDAAAQEDESTIGTGTSMALGCVAGTVVLIGFGLLFLFISTLI